MAEQRWYHRRTYSFPVQIISPVELPAQVIDISDGGISLCLKQVNDPAPLKLGQTIQMIITTDGIGFLSQWQKVKGHIMRKHYDKTENQWILAIEVDGAWDDL